eukprot:scaffold108551_cov33-Prasinocladus_malaysianus.AAC.2
MHIEFSWSRRVAHSACPSCHSPPRRASIHTSTHDYGYFRVPANTPQNDLTCQIVGKEDAWIQCSALCQQLTIEELFRPAIIYPTFDCHFIGVCIRPCRF